MGMVMICCPETQRGIFTGTDRLRIAGMHLDFPAFGHVARRGDGYAFVPDTWLPAPPGNADSGGQQASGMTSKSEQAG